MAALAVPTGINVLGEYGASIGIGYDRIIRDFGGGYQTNELTGPTAGLLTLRLNYGFLPQGTEITVVDAENSNTVTPWAKYVWLFFKRRMADGAAFDVTYTDPATGSTDTDKFVFVDSELTYEEANYKLSTTGIVLKQFIPLA